MRVFDVVLRLLTPAIISAKEGYRGMLYQGVADKILGSTVKGAILTWGLREGVVNVKEVEAEALNPRFCITPFVQAHPSLDTPKLYENVCIAHSLTYVFKEGIEEGDRRVYSLGVKELLKAVRGEKLLEANCFEALSELIMRSYDVLDSSGNIIKSSANTVRASGRSISRLNGFWVLSSDRLNTGAYIGVGIDRLRRSSYPGALFGYEYVEAGTKYVGAVACEEGSVMCRLIDELRRGCGRISVGKYVGRGYGLCEVSVSERREDALNVDVEDGLTALEVIGPTFTIAPAGSNSPPIPRPPAPGDVLAAKVGRGVLRIKVVAILGSASLFRGWSLRTGLPKLAVRALTYGSLILAKLDGDLSVAKSLPYLGIDPRLSANGYGILLPLSEDLIPTAGGG